MLGNSLLQAFGLGVRTAAWAYQLDRDLPVWTDCDRIGPIVLHERRQDRRRRVDEHIEPLRHIARHKAFKHVPFSGFGSAHLGHVLEWIVRDANVEHWSRFVEGILESRARRAELEG